MAAHNLFHVSSNSFHRCGANTLFGSIFLVHLPTVVGLAGEEDGYAISTAAFLLHYDDCPVVSVPYRLDRVARSTCVTGAG